MAHIPPFNEPDRPGNAHAVTGAGVIRVPASAQQAPGAIRRCPVCGQPYAADSQPTAVQPVEPTPADARMVFLCAHCGTYSVGTLDGADEEAGG